MRARLLMAATAALAFAACNGDADPPTTDLTTNAGTDTLGMPAATETTADQAHATLVSATGDTVGRATLYPMGEGVHITLSLQGLTEGEHGLHFHEVGQCDPPAFESAGSHFAPHGRQHGFDNPQGPHAGDLRNVAVGSDGTVEQEIMSEEVTLDDGTTSLFDGDGTALVLHEGPDDYRTDPSGESGDRIACGVVTRGAGS